MIYLNPFSEDCALKGTSVLKGKLLKIFLVYILLMFFVPNFLNAQEISISGTVTDQNDNLLPGVNITVEGTSKGTATDFDGEYSIEVEKGQVLQFSSVGFQDQEITVGDDDTIDVTMEEGSALEEVVVVGYGSSEKSELTGAVSSLKSEDMEAIKNAGFSSALKGMKGRLPGVEIESAGENPGSGSRVLIRGVGTWNNTDPLYIVDGVQVSDINNLNPNDIESIDVQKDASAAAIYGSRAANGVVLVTTKSGEKGKLNIDLNASFGVQKIANKIDVLNAEEWARMSNTAHEAAGDSKLDLAEDPESLGEGTDWQDEIYRVAPVQNYSLGMSGGTEDTKYSVSFGYFDQDGIVKETGYNRFNFRAKSQTKKGRFTFGETAILSKEDWDRVPPADNWGGQGGNAVGAATKMIPAFPVYNDENIGGFAGPVGSIANVQNPLGALNLEKIKDESFKAIINAYAEVELMEGLSYKLNLGYTNSIDYHSDYLKRHEMGQLNHSTNDLSEENTKSPFYMIENTLNFDREFGKHHIEALAGYAIQKDETKLTLASVKDLPDGIKELDAGASSRNSGGNKMKSGLVSYFGRINYSYDKKYLLTASLRRDGSSRFSKNNRYGNFPAVSVGWNIHREDFFQELKPTFTQLKLKASYGKLGNQEFGDYAYTPVVTSNINSVSGTGQNLWSGAVQTSFVDPELKWEETETYDIGLNAGFFENKLQLTADFYHKRTSGILLDLPIPGSAGSLDNPTTNGGIVNNKGFELALSYSGDKGDFSYDVNGTFSAVKNRIKKLAGGEPIFGGQPNLHGASTTTSKEGGSVGAFYLIETDGIFDSEDEVEDHSKDGELIQPNAEPGDIRFVDANGDGKISNSDKVDKGSPFPDFSYGLNLRGSWKNFDLSLSFQGVSGNKIYNGLGNEIEGMVREYNWSKKTLNAWTPDNHSDFPRAITSDPNNNARVSSDRFLESGSYFRMKSLQVGYTLPENVFNDIGMNSLRVYLNFTNLFTITHYSGFNPDLGRGGNILDRGVDFSHESYPLARTATIGLDINF